MHIFFRKFGPQRRSGGPPVTTSGGVKLVQIAKTTVNNKAVSQSLNHNPLLATSNNSNQSNESRPKSAPSTGRKGIHGNSTNKLQPIGLQHNPIVT